jgi:hypothetical protein
MASLVLLAFPAVAFVSAVDGVSAVADISAIAGVPAIAGVLVISSIHAYPGVSIFVGVFTYYLTIALWISGCYLLLLLYYRNIEHQPGKFEKLSDYRIREESLNLSDYRISDSHKTIGLPALLNTNIHTLNHLREMEIDREYLMIVI